MLTNCQLLLHNLPEGAFLLDSEGYIKYANPAVASITGFDVQELLEKSVAIIFNEEDSLRLEFELSQARKKGSFLSEGWKRKKDNSTFWGELVISSIQEHGGPVTGFACSLKNTWEKKKEEVAVRESEERYRLMVGAVKDYAIFMLDLHGNILTWNEGAKKTKGYKADEIIGKHFSIFYTEIDLQDKKPERELRIAVKEGKYEEEGWRVKKNGSVFWANVVITALFNENNQHIGFSKVTRDLSIRRETEEELRQSEERYRSLVEQVTDYGIFMMDENGRIISWNEGAKRIKGYTAEEIIGKYFSIFYTEEDIIKNKPANELKIARKEGKYEEEGWRLRKDKTLFWANVVITAVYNAAGSLIGFSKVTRDLTERKEAERALRESNEKYRVLTNELQITNSELSYANEELEQFTSIVSHDLQEPIRTIKSFLLLIDGKLSEGQTADLRSYIAKSVNAANRMKELIQNLLQYSQLARGEVMLKEISVSDLFQEAVQNVRNAVDISGAEIKMESEVDTINGDRVQLVQLLQNLLSNSLKFTTSKHPKILLSCRKEDGDARFSVSDNGIGFQQADDKKVFEIFRRLNTESAYPGTGIGLAICKKIVERHKGRIWPESAPGKGTTFYFTISDDAKSQKNIVADEKV